MAKNDVVKVLNLSFVKVVVPSDELKQADACKECLFYDICSQGSFKFMDLIPCFVYDVPVGYSTYWSIND